MQISRWFKRMKSFAFAPLCTKTAETLLAKADMRGFRRRAMAEVAKNNASCRALNLEVLERYEMQQTQTLKTSSNGQYYGFSWNILNKLRFDFKRFFRRNTILIELSEIYTAEIVARGCFENLLVFFDRKAFSSVFR